MCSSIVLTSFSSVVITSFSCIVSTSCSSVVITSFLLIVLTSLPLIVFTSFSSIVFTSFSPKNSMPCHRKCCFNPFKPNGFFHPYYSEESILNFRDVRLIFSSLA